MKRFLLMLMSVMFLFAVTSIKATPVDTDIGKVVKTEMSQTVLVETQAAVADFNFCQRTEAAVTSEVTLMYALTDELICPISSQIVNVYNIENYSIYISWVAVLKMKVDNDVGKTNTTDFNITTKEIFT